MVCGKVIWRPQVGSLQKRKNACYISSASLVMKNCTLLGFFGFKKFLNFAYHFYLQRKKMFWVIFAALLVISALYIYISKPKDTHLYLYKTAINGTYEDVLMALAAVNFPSSFWYAGMVIEYGPYVNNDYSKLTQALLAEGIMPDIVERLVYVLTTPHERKYKHD